MNTSDEEKDPSEPNEHTVEFAHTPSDLTNANSVPVRVRYVGDYELLEEIAHGGMGMVYRARQVSLNRAVAVKMILGGQFAGEQDRQRFQNEAESVASLDHPNIIPIYEVGEHEGLPYFSMRYVEGGSLADRIASRKHKSDSASEIRANVDIVVAICDAITYAHQRGILHRDLKPANILMDQNVPMVTDFGLAKRTNDPMATSATAVGVPIGTPAYMSPEQARGDKGLTTATDVYGIGAILYVLLAGRALYDGETPLEIINKVKTGEPKPVRSINRLVDLNLATICHKCLSAEPSHRYASVQYLSDDLNRWLDRKPINARRASLLERYDRWVDRNPYLVAACVCTIAILFGISSFVAMSYRATTLAYEELEKTNYINNIALAAQAAEGNKQLDLSDRLVASMPRERETDHRGWEWHYLNRQATLDFVKYGENNSLQCSMDPQENAIVCQLPSIMSGRLFNVWTKSSPGIGPLGKFALCNPSYEVRTNDYCGGNLKWSREGSYFSFETYTNFTDSPNPLANGLRIWDYKTETTYWFYSAPKGQSIASHAWSKNGNSIAVLLNDLTVQILNLKSRSVIRKMNLEGALKGVTPQGLAGATWISESVIAISGAGECLFLDSTTGEQLKKWDFHVLDWSKDGKRWVSKMGVGNVDSPEPIFKHPFVNAYWSHNSNYIASVDQGRVSIISPDSGNETELFSRPNSWISLLDWLADDSGILVQSHTDGQVLCLRTQLHTRGTSIYRLPDKTRAKALAVSSNGQHVAVRVDDSSTVLVLDEQGVELSKFDQHNSTVLAMDWQPKGELIATLDRSNQLFVWDSKTGEVAFKHELPKSESKFNSDTDYQLEWRHDGRFLAASANGSVLAWECDQWTLRVVMPSLQSKGKLDSYPNLRLSGWDLDNGKLVSERISSSAFLSPTTSAAEDFAPWRYSHLGSWDPADNQFRWFSVPFNSPFAPGVTKLVKQSSQTSRDKVAIGYLGYHSKELHRFTLTGSNMLSSASTQSLGLRGKYDLEELSGRIFATDRDGRFVVADAETGTRLLEIVRGPIDAFDCENGKLWVASAGTITCYDGSPQPDRMRLPSRNELRARNLQQSSAALWEPDFIDRAALGWGVIVFLVMFFPMWLWSGMSLSSALDRWESKKLAKKLLKRQGAAGEGTVINITDGLSATAILKPTEMRKPLSSTLKGLGALSILLGVALILKRYNTIYFDFSFGNLEQAIIKIIFAYYSLGFAISLLVLARAVFIGPRWLSSLAATLFLCFVVAYIQFEVAGHFRYDLAELSNIRSITIVVLSVGAVACASWSLLVHWRAETSVLANWYGVFATRPTSLDWVREALLHYSLGVVLFTLANVCRIVFSRDSNVGFSVYLLLPLFSVVLQCWSVFCMIKATMHRGLASGLSLESVGSVLLRKVAKLMR